MGYAIVMSPCAACKMIVHYNPHKVPSIRINGSREPLCRRCAERWCELHPEAPRPDLSEAYAPVPEYDL